MFIEIGKKLELTTYKVVIEKGSKFRGDCAKTERTVETTCRWLLNQDTILTTTWPCLARFCSCNNKTPLSLLKITTAIELRRIDVAIAQRGSISEVDFELV
ncbi:hypothetical protein NC652_039762 [Populus alba x Populus x berolinensis]|uniref:Uncharacterized protein n=1 Tax=Populus alba x Populus x berolinensis TaxID=444605 RepID=A0AAD6PRP9_9ROSI|nr:hypothetical protein NC652_039762 [Populus alba x Populus x berolinensis]KAJ6957849.1 hypothetical protein NC653_039737 [Populus alba x Populus x berolinensis]